MEQFCTNEMSVDETGLRRLQAVPNPATDHLFLTDVPPGATVSVTDLLGRPVCAPIHMDGQDRIPTTDWPRGWVVVRATSDSGTLTARVLLN